MERKFNYQKNGLRILDLKIKRFKDLGMGEPGLHNIYLLI